MGEAQKNAFSEAASIFGLRQPLRDYQGRVALDSCLPRLESSGHFSGSLLVRKRELSLMEEHSPLVKSPQKGYHKEKSKGALLMRAYERLLKYAKV